MTREEAIKALKVEQENRDGDVEVVHVHADEILCKFLRELGYADVVEEWEKVDRWYS